MLKADAIITGTDPIILDRREQIVAFASRHKLPTMGFVHQFAAAGALLSYGPSISWMYRQAGDYIGQILKGANPAEMPVLQPTQFELVINLKTAKALGVDGAANGARPRRRGDRITHLNCCGAWVSCWHVCDMPGLSDDVRSSGKTGSGLSWLSGPSLTRHGHRVAASEDLLAHLAHLPPGCKMLGFQNAILGGWGRMHRRKFIAIVGGVALTWPVVGRAQPTMPVIGFLNGSSPDGYAPMVSAFVSGLRGWLYRGTERRH